MLTFCRRNWYHGGGVVFTALAFIMGFWGNDDSSRIEVILIYSFISLLAHQFEEYALPGGSPCAQRRVLWREERLRPLPRQPTERMLVNRSFATSILIEAVQLSRLRHATTVNYVKDRGKST
jgi:hypothetical protein